MALIQYVGTKPHGRPDTVAGTNIRWDAPGDVKQVPDSAALLLLRHPDIWKHVDAGTHADAAAAPAQLPPPAPKYALEPADGGAAIVLDAMDDAALKAFAEQHGIAVDKRLKADKLRAAIYEAATTAGDTEGGGKE